MSLTDFLNEAASRKNTLELRVDDYNKNYLKPYIKELAQIAVALKLTLPEGRTDLNSVQISFNINGLSLLSIDELCRQTVKKENRQQHPTIVSLNVESKVLSGTRSLTFSAELTQVTKDDFITNLYHASKTQDKETGATNENNHHKTPEIITSQPKLTRDAFNEIEHFLNRDEWMRFVDNLGDAVEDSVLIKKCDDIISKNGKFEIPPLQKNNAPAVTARIEGPVHAK